MGAKHSKSTDSDESTIKWVLLNLVVDPFGQIQFIDLFLVLDTSWSVLLKSNNLLFS